MSRMETVGVVIVHYHHEDSLATLLESLPAQGVPYDRVVIADNGSDADLIAPARAVADQATFLSLPNPGYGAAVNAAVRTLDPVVDVIVVLTHEVALGPLVLAELVQELDSDAMVGLVGPRLMDQTTGRVWSLGGRLTLLGRPANVGRGSTDWAGPRRRFVAWLDGACFAMRREDLCAIGGMSEVFHLYFEDVDLGLRVRRDLHKNVVVRADVEASQAAGGSLKAYLATRNLLWLYALHGHRIWRRVLIAETAARILLGPLLRPRGSRERRASRLAGLRDGWLLPLGSCDGKAGHAEARRHGESPESAGDPPRR